MKIGPREIIFSVLMTGLLVASYGLGFARMDARRVELDGTTLRRQRELADLAWATRDIDDLAAKTNALAKAIEFFEGKLPRDKDVDGILQQVTDLADQQQLVNKSFTPRKMEAGANYRELPIEVSFSGNFRNFYGFLLSLERLPRLTRISQMTLRRLQERDGDMQADVRLSIFFEPATPAGDAAPDATTPLATVR